VDDDFFSLDVAADGDLEVVSLGGELDAANAERLERALLESVAGSVVVDLTGLRFIDSSGLTALVHARNAITGCGRHFGLRGASGSVQRVFEITGLTTLLADG
jgi:anti-sigma B factor antagonist